MKWCIVAICGLVAACGDPQPTPESEVAAELRALRATLVHSTPQAPVVAAPDLAQLTAALSPLRDALGALTAQQAEQQQRQLALTQELTRWSQLLVESVGATRRDEVAAMNKRLQQMESALADQEARHRQVETLIQGALDRTADRLEEFLQRLGGSATDGTPPATAPGTPTTPPPAGSAANGAKSVGAGVRSSRGARSAAMWWWSGIALGGACLGVVCFRRWRRSAPDAHAGAAEPAPPVDQGVQEIWATAALLGEAVGRLRDAQPQAEAEEPASGEAPGESESHGGDFVVLDDELLQPFAIASTARTAAPEGIVCRIRADDPARAMQAVLQVLAEDPRVLRRPEPTVRCSRDSLEVTFRAVPHLPAGERVHLEQRLRDACA